MTADPTIAAQVRYLLGGKHLRMTPCDLERSICKVVSNTSRSAVRATIRSLLSHGELIYTHHFSSTHLEINYRQPVRISERLVLSSPMRVPPTAPETQNIQIQDGVSFGAGDHPTTRMLLRGLDFVMAQDRAAVGENNVSRMALDVGTGTGILAIAAAALGVEQVVAIDTDPIACHEAGANVRLNGYSHRITISNQSLESLPKKSFHFILANLRPPTIRQLIPELIDLSTSKAIWLLSGFRAEEGAKVMKFLPGRMTAIFWREEVSDWVAIGVRRISVGCTAQK